MATLSQQQVLYHLSNEENDLHIRAIVGAGGSIATLSYRAGDAQPREFSGEEITTIAAGAGVRATVMLDDGGASHQTTSFELVLPIVVLGGDVSEEGPFGVHAAGLRITTFIVTTGAIAPGPQEEFEAIQLFARAIAHHPEG
jgi:hypothetical protein